MSVVDQIKARLDIVDIIGSYTQVKKAGRNYKALCPFHGEKTPSFIIFPDSQTWRCFGQCNEGGDIFSFVMKRESWDFSEALRELAHRADVELESYQPTAQQDSAQDRQYTLLSIAAEFYNDLLPGSPSESYAIKRGLSPDTVHQFGLGYAPDEWNAALTHLTQLGFDIEEVIEAGVAIRNDKGNVYDRFRQRFMIPIRDEKGRVIGFGARALAADQEPKYLNSPQSTLFDKSHTLYGLDLARRAIRESETAVIVEGYMDVIQAHQAGYHNVVAQMGTALTEHQLRMLSKYAQKLILALDTDAAGIKATMRGLEVARETLGDSQVFVLDTQGIMRQAGQLNLDIRVLELSNGKDPDDFLRATPHLWEDQITAALPLAEYIIKVGTADLPSNASIKEREARAHELLPLLTATEDDLQRHGNVQLLSHKLRLDPRSMVEWAISRTRQVLPPKPTRDKKERQPRPAAPPMKTSLSMRGRELEKHCLAVLLREPGRIYEANRLLREIGNGEGNILPLQTGDFSQGDFQAIFALLEKACQQDSMEPLDYLLHYTDYDLRLTIDSILPEPLAVFLQKVEKIHATELHSLQREREQRRWQPMVKDEFPQLMLKLRRDRIQQESKEIYFLLSEAHEQADEDLEQTYMTRFQQLKQIILTLDRAIQTMQQGEKGSPKNGG